MLFETPRLYVRRFTGADLDNVHAIAGDAEVMKHIRPATTMEGSKELLDNSIRAYALHPHLGRFAVIEKPDRYAGNFVLRHWGTGKDIEIGYSFVPHAWGKGFATELTRQGIIYGFETMGVQRIIALTNIHNTNSQKVLLKCGFVQLPNIIDKGVEVSLFEITR
jgi:ribosomal-protein-alanine N-acetyltransferase